LVKADEGEVLVDDRRTDSFGFLISESFLSQIHLPIHYIMYKITGEK